jgi:O-antigen biosynthesis protein
VTSLEPGSDHRHFNPWLHDYYARFGATNVDGERLSIAFVIGSTDIGGGNNVIFQHALRAQEAGLAVTVIPMLEVPGGAPRWHRAIESLRFASFEEVASERFDLALATWWPTVFELPRLRFRHAAYFIQSIESRFYATGAGSEFAALAELSYLIGLPVITIATWIQSVLAFQHRTPSFLVRNGIDKGIFTPDGPALAPRVEGRLRILIEGPVEVEMKGVQRSVELARSGSADEVWLLTSSSVGQFPGCDRVISRIPIAQTPEVYRSCDILLKLSQVEGMFGPPLEMMHCGGTVITNDVTGADEYVVSGSNGIVVPTDDADAVVEALESLRDPDLLTRLREGAALTAQRWPDWEASSSEFLRVVTSLCRQDPPANMVEMMMMASGARELHRRVTMRE